MITAGYVYYAVIIASNDVEEVAWSTSSLAKPRCKNGWFKVAELDIGWSEPDALA